MKRSFRLTRSVDFKRVRLSGKSYAHPLVLLYVAFSDQPGRRVGVSAGLAVGNAVKRNRAKRLLRAAIRDFLPEIHPGTDLLLIARSPLPQADLTKTREAISALLKRAGLLSPSYDG